MKSLARISLAVAALAAFVTSSAHAGITDNWFSGFLNQSSDNSGEFLVKAPGNVGGASILEVGDILATISTLESNEDLDNGGGPQNYVINTGNEATVLSLIEVSSILPLGGGLANIEFSPLSAGNRAFVIGGGAGAAIGAEVATWDPRTMIALYDDPSLDYTRLGTGHDDGDGQAVIDPMGAKANLPDDTGSGSYVTEDGIATTSFNGAKILEVGVIGVGNEYWSSTAAALDINVLESVPIATAVGLINFGLNEIPGTNLTGFTFSPVANFNPVSLIAGFSHFNGSGSILGIGAQASATGVGTPSTILGPSTPFDAFNNIDVVFRPNRIAETPEPSTVVLLGLGTVLLAGRRSRRRRCA